MPSGIKFLAGLELGGVAISTALSLTTGLPQVLVRKQSKSYGTPKSIEGPDVTGHRVLVVEDVITTGGQVVASASDLRNAGAQVEFVLCVLDRRTPIEPRTERLSEEGLSVLHLYTLDELVPRG
jgi:orotate phosphoribosyltransferase